MATQFVPFDPGKLNDETLRNLEQVRSKFNEAVQAVNLRDTEIQRLGNVGSELQRRITEADRLLGTRAGEIESLRKELAVQAARANGFKDKLDGLLASPPKIGVQELVSHFKGNIDRINADVLSQKSPGMLVDNVEVEVHCGIDVKEGLQITQLPASALGVASTSLLKFNLRSSAALKIVDDEST